MEQENIREQIFRYYAGTLTEQERTALLKALDLLTTTELEELYPLEEWQMTDAVPLSDAVIEAALQRHHQLRPVTRIKRMPVWAKAACVAGVAGLLTWLFYHNQAGTFPEQSPMANASYKVVHVADGKKKTITLADGSKLIAGGGTTLHLPENFIGGQREIFMEDGEVFFDIQKDVSKPFIVHTKGMDIQVLGTSFNVRNYKDEANGSVIVRSGKVAVSQPAQKWHPVYLLPGHKAVLDKTAASLAQMATDTTAAFGWMNEAYVFRGATLRTIIAQLKHGYGVKFEIRNNSLMDKKFSATFQQNSIPEIMQQLQLMGGINYTIQSDRIIIE